MVTTVYIDASGAIAADTAKFVRTVASETTDTVYTAARLTKRVTGDSTLANSHGGPGLLFQRGYGSTDAHDTGFAILGASYEGVTNDHEFNFLTSTNAFATAGESLLTLSRKNADFNVPVGMNAYANLTAINAIPSPAAGMVVYNTATGTLYVYTGSQWNDVGVTAQSSYTLPAATSSALGGVIIPAVGTSGITNSSGTIGLATASTTQLGAVKVDGSTVTINGSGVISANTSYTLPTASTTVLGGVKVDGSTITINGSGVITSNSTSTLNGLTDVTLTSPSLNQLLVYNGSQWVNNAVISTSTLPQVIFERQTTVGAAAGIYGAVRVRRRITDAATGYDRGGAGIVFESIGTDEAGKGNALIGARNNTGDISDFVILTSNSGGGTDYQETISTSRSRTNINQGVLYVDKTNSRVGINDTTPEYALDVTGQVRATSGFIGNLTGNADTVTNGVVTTGSYADPAWITSLAYSKITGAPTVTTSLDGLTDVTITNAQKGKLLVRGASDWVDTSTIEFDNTSYRPKFVNNSNPGGSGANSAAEFLKNTGDAPATGDGTGILFGSVQSNGTKKLFSRLISTYESSELHKVYIQSSNNSFDINSPNINNLAMFAGDGSQIYTDLTVSGGLTVDNGTLTVDKTNNRVGVNTTSPNFTLDVGGSSYINGYATFGNDIEIQGSALRTNQTTFNVINTTATTINAFGAATTINIGAATGTTNISNALKVTGNSISSSSAVAIGLSGASVEIKNNLQVTGGEIKSGGGTTAITLSGANTTLAGDLTIGGQVIKSGNGTTAITLTDTTGNITVAGSLRINGNNIIAGDGDSRITFDDLGGQNRTNIQGNARITGNLTVDGAFTPANFSPSTISTTTLSATNFTVNSGGYANFNSPVFTDDITVEGKLQLQTNTITSGAISIANTATVLNNTGNVTYTLAAPIADGQIKVISKGGYTNTTNITVSSASWKGGGTGTLSTTSGVSTVTLIGINGQWWIQSLHLFTYS